MKHGGTNIIVDAIFIDLYYIHLINVNSLLSLGKEKLRAEPRRQRGQGSAVMISLGDRT